MKPHKSHTVAEATTKLMRFCAYRERCHKEVCEKLTQLHMIPEAQNHIINKLLEEDFLNEERFAKTFVRDKFRLKRWGKHRIIRGLRFREISDYLIDKAIEKEIDEDEYRRTFEKLFQKRLHSIKETHPLKKKKKIADHLLRKGYDSTMIYEALANTEL